MVSRRKRFSHASVRIGPDVYRLAGEVYGEVTRKEPWCAGAQSVTEIGVLTPEEFTPGAVGVLSEALKGATRILEQGGHQFDVLDSTSDFSKYRGLPTTEHAMYRRGMAIEAGAETKVLAPIVGSFFDRTYRHFCSHRQTPSSGREVQPGIIRKGRCI